MNLGEIITRVQRQFGDDSGAQITQADIIRWSNDAQVEIVRQTECLQIHAETDSIADDGSYDVPTDFIRLRRVTYEGIPLHRTNLEDLDGSTRGAIAEGTPTKYYLWGEKLFLHPVPTSSGSGVLDIYYLKRPDTLVASNDVPEIPVHLHEDIVRYCLARAKELDEEDGKAQEVMSDFSLRMMQAREEQFSNEQDSYTAVRALPGDY